MQQFESDALDLANAMIDEFGEAVTWRQTRNGTPPNPAQPWKPGANVDTDFPVTICFLPSNRRAMAAQMFMQGTNIPNGYMLAIMAGNPGFVPTLEDRVIRDGKSVSVEWIDTFNPAGTPLYYM